MKPVLIVEDETILRESLRDWLKDVGYEVETAEEGEEALEKIGKKEFSVAVLDLRLPGKDGLEVLKKATAKDPKIKGIIMTAYPSIETAVEARKLGAVDYIVKPFAPDALEKTIQEALGPVQVEIKPEKGKIEEAEVAEVITITEEEIPAHLKRGQTYFSAGLYKEALREFESIMQITPGYIEARIWVRRSKEALVQPKEVAEEKKYCLWMKLGLVSYRLCTFDYDCLGCEFDQNVRERIDPEDVVVKEVLRRQLELPGDQRFCRYALKGEVSYRLCSRVFQCATCEFAQLFEYATEQKLAAREEAMNIKEQSNWWSYWHGESQSEKERIQ